MTPRQLDPTTAFARATELASTRRRAILGVTGAPGAGKSTYAEALTAKLAAEGHKVALVPMDGYHLAQASLEELGLSAVKGAPHTFDAAGYVALLRRLKESPDETVWAPRFNRELEDSIAASIPVRPEVTLVVTEGNYLLFDSMPWATIRPLLDECWFLELDKAVRHERLESRHLRYGRSPEAARERTFGSDEANARLIEATAPAADAIVYLS